MNEYPQGMKKLIMSQFVPEEVQAGMHFMEDPKALEKSAATIFGCDYSDVRPDKDHVGIHVVGLGDFETYGSNRNGDSFPKVACIKYHDTFVRNGAVFRNHQNKDRAKSLGQIVKSAYNPDMGRVELFLHVHKDKAAAELQKLAKHGEHAFSMACFLAGTIVNTLRGFIPIEDVVVGDMVLTHTGEWRRVTNTMRRKSDHYNMVTFVGWGRTAVGVTDEHPWFAARFEDIPGRRNADTPTDAQYRLAHRTDLHKHLDWVPTEALTDQHYVAVPITSWEDLDCTVDQARIWGYYMSEGTLAGKNGDHWSTVEFSCNKDDDAVDELVRLSAGAATVHPHPVSDQAVVVRWCNTELAEELNALFGHGPSKRVPDQLMHAPTACKLAFAATWFNGDGWQDARGLHWSIAPQHRALELQRILGAIGLPSSCSRIDHPFDRGTVKSENMTEYVVSLSNHYSEVFAMHSKAGTRYSHGLPKTRTFISGDYLMVPVKQVERTEEVVDVYNISVADDESYAVYNLSVHNCRVPYDRCNICNTLRKSASDTSQCDHVRHELRQTRRDGSLVCTHNDTPTFFDMSFVNRPADRIAWDLKVASADELDSIKLAEVSGLWVPDHLAIVDSTAQDKLKLFTKLADYQRQFLGFADSPPRTAGNRHMWELRKAATYTLTDTEIDLLRAEEPASVLAKLAQLGVVLPAPLFFKYAFGTDYGELAPHMDGILDYIRRGVFVELEKSGAYQTTCTNPYFDVDPYNVVGYSGMRNPKSGVLSDKSLVKVASFVGSGVGQRVIDKTIAGEAPEITVRKAGQIKMATSDLSIIEKSAEIYASYKLSAVQAIKAPNGVDEHTLIALTAVQDLLT